MFRERLQGIVDRVRGAKLVALVGGDGLPIQSFEAESSPPHDASLDMDYLCAEVVLLAQAMSKHQEEFDGGEVRTITTSTGHSHMILSVVGPGAFLLLLTDRSTCLGRARFELRRAVLDFAADLE